MKKGIAKTGSLCYDAYKAKDFLNHSECISFFLFLEILLLKSNE